MSTTYGYFKKIISLCLLSVLLFPILVVHATAWDPTTATYTRAFDVSGQSTGNYSGLTFNNNGTKMFVTVDYDKTYVYTLSTGFDISTASYSTSNSNDSFYGILFNNDGTKMYYSDYTSFNLEGFTLSTAYDPSSRSSWKTGPGDSGAYAAVFNDDGTKLFWATASGEGSQEGIKEYTLSTAYDVSSYTYVDTFDTTNEITSSEPGWIRFNDDGTKMFVLKSTATNNLYIYTLSTGFDVSTASHSSTFGLPNSAQAGGLAFNSDGTKMFVMSESTDEVYEYSLPGGGVEVPEFSTWALLLMLGGCAYLMEQRGLLSFQI